MVAGLPLTCIKGRALGYKSTGRSRIYDSTTTINTIDLPLCLYALPVNLDSIYGYTLYVALASYQFNYFIMEPTFSSAASVATVTAVLAAQIQAATAALPAAHRAASPEREIVKSKDAALLGVNFRKQPSSRYSVLWSMHSGVGTDAVGCGRNAAV
jgi:hypothetical protein